VACEQMTDSFDDTVPPALLPIYRYWDRKRDGRRMPRRADIDPIELGPFLSRLMIVDVTNDDRRFVYGFVGTREVQVRRRDPTGHSVAEAFMGSSREKAVANYERVVTTGQPLVSTGTVVTTEQRIDTSQVIFLPISEDDQNVSQILVFTFFEY
jgi:hypothetical protein